MWLLQSLIHLWLKGTDMGVPELLVDQSTLTKTQLESLRSYVRVARGELRLREAASQRSAGGVTIGSYYRTVSQARTKIKESIVTVVIGLWLGLVESEDVRRLFDLVGKGAAELSGEDAERLARVLQVLIEKVVM
jgi:hypothetical protein